ncbi:MAG: cell wall-binding repeat-containing protein [Finegoldia magna]|uniref:cell wall-binding repeat-containing protein n=1 Tax=Finegoldia magna TaxID=1260 RepID=UPI0027B99D2E|nr:cell wall-binding repeat-containing protein [Finegoldia magna]MDU1400017.1 cell wall-binding repeat-containing protein [Finegoldia magna]MDU5368643.1 cell wall-binding repeat-containing protein [Finegoldia magna]MDU5444484.1 cell wall-binding repeat-containing protein [Finegoldia magna]MDU5507264.1 cell wall-binding repeat-containing protein [Finegoldia magna]MDU7384570.1 cell wall-binding repeat-containing protein [Finegoldia magna]
MNKTAKALLALGMVFSIATTATYTTTFAETNVKNDVSTTATQTQEESQIRFPILTIGKDQSERNFTWYSKSKEQGYLEIVEANDQKDFSNATKIKAVTSDKNTTFDINDKSNAKVKIEKDKKDQALKDLYELKDMSNSQVNIKNLKPNTKYMYRVYNGNGKKSQVFEFTTQAKGDFTFVLAGDPQIGAGKFYADRDKWEKALGTIKKQVPQMSFLYSLGDQVNEYTSKSELEYSGYIERENAKGITFATLIGNHDSQANSYSQHFALPNLQAEGATEAGSNYYFVYNNTLFIQLNSNNMNTAEHKATIEKAIEMTKNQNIKWKVVGFHHAIYSAATHANDDDIIKRRAEYPALMKQYGIDLIVSGHDHVYTRSRMMNGGVAIESERNFTDKSKEEGKVPSKYVNPKGQLYLTANSASGSKHYDLVEFKDYMAVRDQHYKPNFTEVKVTDKSIVATTYETDSLKVVDQVEIEKSTADKTNENVKRISGVDREQTAIEVSKKMFKDGTNKVVLANKNNYSDVLTAAPFAKANNASLLYISSNSISKEVMSEIARLKAKEITIIGGEKSVNEGLKKELEKRNFKVDRLSGADRYKTSAQIAAKLIDGKTTTLEIASGENYADALSLNNAAEKDKAPILLVRVNAIDKSVEDVIKSSKASLINIAGGEKSVSENTKANIKKISKATVNRMGGADRYETSILLAKYSGAKEVVVVASGENFADALVAAPFSAKQKGAILLTNKDKLGQNAEQFIKDTKFNKSYVIGGEKSVSEDVINQLTSIIK